MRQHMQCAMRREPTVSGQHTQPTRATQGRGQGMLRGSLGASVSSLSSNLQGGAGTRTCRRPTEEVAEEEDAGPKVGMTHEPAPENEAAGHR